MKCLMEFKLIFYKTFALIYLLICANVSAADDEISFGIAMGTGIMEDVSGLHGVVTGNKGTNIKSLSLDDDSLNTNISLNLDYNKKLKNDIYLKGYSVINSVVRFIKISIVTIFHTSNLIIFTFKEQFLN